MLIRRKSEALRNERQGHTRHQCPRCDKRSKLKSVSESDVKTRLIIYIYIYIHTRNAKVKKEPWREIVDLDISAIGLCQEVIYCSNSTISLHGSFFTLSLHFLCLNYYNRTYAVHPMSIPIYIYLYIYIPIPIPIYLYIYIYIYIYIIYIYIYIYIYILSKIEKQ